MGCKICSEIFNENINEQILRENIDKKTSDKLQSSNNNNNNYFSNKINLDKDKYIKEVINLINLKRKDHNVLPLIEDKELDEIAQNYSEKISITNDLNNSKNTFNGEELGESLFSCSRPIEASKLVDNWYRIGQNYDESNPKASHYTQMIWKNSQKIGVGITQSNTGYFYIVANYYPGGNIEGQFKENVLPKKNVIISENNNNNLYQSNNNFEIEYNEESSNLKNLENTNVNNVIFTSEEFANEALIAHNIYREKHHVPPVTLNREICLLAQKHANIMALNEDFLHSHNTYKGEELAENLFMCTGYKISGQNMVETWYNEGKDYDYNGDFQKGSGHFTQIVWKETKEVGFAYAQSKNGTFYAVGHYYPPGNFLGEFSNNVFPE
jgi:uncharacterized protein YkwD